MKMRKNWTERGPCTPLNSVPTLPKFCLIRFVMPLHHPSNPRLDALLARLNVAQMICDVTKRG